jgi:hypothetical protein
MAAMSSMRLLVVCGSPPLSSRVWPFHCRIAPQPPGPGFPEQAPSVKIEAQLAPVFERILRPHQRARRNVEPVDQSGEQKTQRGAARQHRKRGAFRILDRPDFSVGLQQRAPLGDVERMIGLEAPCVEADRKIVGQRIVAGEIEVDQP